LVVSAVAGWAVERLFNASLAVIHYL